MADPIAYTRAIEHLEEARTAARRLQHALSPEDRELFKRQEKLHLGRALRELATP